MLPVRERKDKPLCGGGLGSVGGAFDLGRALAADPLVLQGVVTEDGLDAHADALHKLSRLLERVTSGLMVSTSIGEPLFGFIEFLKSPDIQSENVGNIVEEGLLYLVNSEHGNFFYQVF